MPLKLTLEKFDNVTGHAGKVYYVLHEFPGTGCSQYPFVALNRSTTNPEGCEFKIRRLKPCPVEHFGKENRYVWPRDPRLQCMSKDFEDVMVENSFHDDDGPAQKPTESCSVPQHLMPVVQKVSSVSEEACRKLIGSSFSQGKNDAEPKPSTSVSQPNSFPSASKPVPANVIKVPNPSSGGSDKSNNVLDLNKPTHSNPTICDTSSSPVSQPVNDSPNNAAPSPAQPLEVSDDKHVLHSSSVQRIAVLKEVLSCSALSSPEISVIRCTSETNNHNSKTVDSIERQSGNLNDTIITNGSYKQEMCSSSQLPTIGAVQDPPPSQIIAVPSSSSPPGSSIKSKSHQGETIDANEVKNSESRCNNKNVLSLKTDNHKAEVSTVENASTENSSLLGSTNAPSPIHRTKIPEVSISGAHQRKRTSDSPLPSEQTSKSEVGRISATPDTKAGRTASVKSLAAVEKEFDEYVDFLLETAMESQCSSSRSSELKLKKKGEASKDASNPPTKERFVERREKEEKAKKQLPLSEFVDKPCKISKRSNSIPVLTCSIAKHKLPQMVPQGPTMLKHTKQDKASRPANGEMAAQMAELLKKHRKPMDGYEVNEKEFKWYSSNTKTRRPSRELSHSKHEKPVSHSSADIDSHKKHESSSKMPSNETSLSALKSNDSSKQYSRTIVQGELSELPCVDLTEDISNDGLPECDLVSNEGLESKTIDINCTNEVITADDSSTTLNSDQPPLERQALDSKLGEKSTEEPLTVVKTSESDSVPRIATNNTSKCRLDENDVTSDPVCTSTDALQSSESARIVTMSTSVSSHRDPSETVCHSSIISESPIQPEESAAINVTRNAETDNTSTSQNHDPLDTSDNISLEPETVNVLSQPESSISREENELSPVVSGGESTTSLVVDQGQAEAIECKILNTTDAESIHEKLLTASPILSDDLLSKETNESSLVAENNNQPEEVCPPDQGTSNRLRYRNRKRQRKQISRRSDNNLLVPSMMSLALDRTLLVNRLLHARKFLYQRLAKPFKKRCVRSRPKPDKTAPEKVGTTETVDISYCDETTGSTEKTHIPFLGDEFTILSQTVESSSSNCGTDDGWSVTANDMPGSSKEEQNVVVGASTSYGALTSQDDCSPSLSFAVEAAQANQNAKKRQGKDRMFTPQVKPRYKCQRDAKVSQNAGKRLATNGRRRRAGRKNVSALQTWFQGAEGVTGANQERRQDSHQIVYKGNREESAWRRHVRDGPRLLGRQVKTFTSHNSMKAHAGAHSQTHCPVGGETPLTEKWDTQKRQEKNTTSPGQNTTTHHRHRPNQEAASLSKARGLPTQHRSWRGRSPSRRKVTRTYGRGGPVAQARHHTSFKGRASSSTIANFFQPLKSGTLRDLRSGAHKSRSGLIRKDIT